MAPRARRSWLLLAACFAVSGCVEPGYFVRAGWSEARLLLRREPIDALLARPDLGDDLRGRLELTLAVREFAESALGLHVGESYTTFAEVPDDAQVWVVSAARRDALELHTWRYPLVGRLPYRGFFDRAAAERAAAALGREDLDTEVRPAVAFSTLGWFADPLLSTTARRPAVAVADTVLHELWPATLFIPGEAAFNESAATFAGHRGAVAFFCSGPRADAARCTEARTRWNATRVRGRILGRLSARLRRLYAARRAREHRERVRIAAARAAGRALERHGVGDVDDVVPPNNAALLGELIYLTGLDRFEALAPTDADLPAALRTLAQTARGARDPFAAVAALARTVGEG